jgi:protein SCO1/2
MQNESRYKLFALGIVIVLPLFFLLVFRPLSKVPRPKTPPKLFPTGVVEQLNEKGETVIDSVYHVVPNFKFQTQSGDSLELDSLRGNIYIVNFFFATCPGICPKLNAQMERIQKNFIHDTQVKLISISVDPDRDSVQALRRYSQDRDAIPGKWYFLRGSKSDVFKLAEQGYFVTAKDDNTGGAEDFMHSEKLVLVDWDGNIRGYYSGLDSNRVSTLMGDMVLLLRYIEKNFSFRKQKPNEKRGEKGIREKKD